MPSLVGSEMCIRDRVGTLQYHAIIASLTGWRSSLYTQPFARYILLYDVLLWVVSIYSMGVSIIKSAINRYKVTTFLEQLISWAASEISCADNSY